MIVIPITKEGIATTGSFHLEITKMVKNKGFTPDFPFKILFRNEKNKPIKDKIEIATIFIVLSNV